MAVRRPAWAPVIPAVPAGTWRAAGNRFFKRVIVPPVPIGRYTGRASGVPLTDGQAQGLMPLFPSGAGSVNSPGALATIAQVTVPAAGTYTISWTATLAGTLGPADVNNMVLFKNVSLLAAGTFPAVAGSYPQAKFTVAAAAGDIIGIGTNGAATAGSVYSGSFSSTSGGDLTLAVGPQGLGNVWYPAQVTLSTGIGPLDTATAFAYYGIGGVPTTLVGTVVSGNGTVALALPPMQPGEFIIVTWTGGTGGEQAALNITGSMDALTTG